MGFMNLFSFKNHTNTEFNNETLRAAVKLWLKKPKRAEKKYGHISSWNTSQVTDMKNLFDNAGSFNQPIGNWNVSNVKNMSGMFSHASSFNQPLNSWNVSNVCWMRYMFYGASSFNQPLDRWDVSGVMSMNGMFAYSKFDQELKNWDTSNVKDMSRMFEGNTSFNQIIVNWNVSNVTEMNQMFYHADSFNQLIGDWDVTEVEDSFTMFTKENMVVLYGTNGEGLMNKATVGLYTWTVSRHPGGPITMVDRREEVAINKMWISDEFYESGEIKLQHKFCPEYPPIIEFRSFFKNGNVQLIWEHLDGVQSGKEIEYDKIGNKITERNFIDGKQDGETVEYYENSNIKRVVNFTDGKPHGQATVFFDSVTLEKIKEVSFFSGGVLNGKYLEFYKNSSLKKKYFFKNGELDGEQILFYEDGQVKEISNFANGVKNGKTITFTNFGMIARDQMYQNGEVIQEKYKVPALKQVISLGTNQINNTDDDNLKTRKIIDQIRVVFIVCNDTTLDYNINEYKEPCPKYLNLIKEIQEDLLVEIKNFNKVNYNTKYHIEEPPDIDYYFNVICARAWNHIIDLDLNPSNKYEWQEFNVNTYSDTYSKDLKLGEEHFIKTLESPLICFIHIYDKLNHTINRIRNIGIEFKIGKNNDLKVYDLLQAHAHAAVYAYINLLKTDSSSYSNNQINNIFENFNLKDQFKLRKLKK